MIPYLINKHDAKDTESYPFMSMVNLMDGYYHVAKGRFIMNPKIMERAGRILNNAGWTTLLCGRNFQHCRKFYSDRVIVINNQLFNSGFIARTF